MSSNFFISKYWLLTLAHFQHGLDLQAVSLIARGVALGLGTWVDQWKMLSRWSRINYSIDLSKFHDLLISTHLRLSSHEWNRTQIAARLPHSREFEGHRKTLRISIFDWFDTLSWQEEFQICQRPSRAAVARARDFGPKLLGIWTLIRYVQVRDIFLRRKLTVNLN